VRFTANLDFRCGFIDATRCGVRAARWLRPRYGTCWLASSDTIVTWNDSGVAA
jgi:hypothetical protein